ncbi:MAG: hypothetical protein ACRD8O_16855 [Bryobacteraceae bacterium]
MQSMGQRFALLSGLTVVLFVLAVVVLVRLVPGPHTEGDYLIIGCLATLVSLLALFVIIITTWMKIPDAFFKRRKK